MTFQQQIIKILNGNPELAHEQTPEELAELHKVLFEIWHDVNTVCEKNNITCFISGGSCLGTVRHKGFIPWDDDIDTMLFRKDYDRIPALLEENFPGKYCCVGPGLSDKCQTGFIRVTKAGTVWETIFDSDESLGVHIDMFPMDYVPENKFLQKLHGIKLMFLFSVATVVKKYHQHSKLAKKILVNNPKSFFTYYFEKFIGFFFSFFPAAKWFAMCDKAGAKQKESNYVAIAAGRKHYFGEIYPVSMFIPAKKMEFNGEMANVPNDYDSYLRNLYGDYMQIPPVEKREKHFIVKLEF